MQNIVAHHVETSTSRKQEARNLGGFVCFVCKAAGGVLDPPQAVERSSLGGQRGDAL